jgi:hypothetical protein
MNSQFTTISLGDRPFLKMFETTNIQTMNMRFSKISLLCGYLSLKEGIGVGDESRPKDRVKRGSLFGQL